MSPNRLFIVTGDHSADIHAGKVVKHLRTLDPTLEVAAVGSEALREAGATLVADQTRMGQVGLGTFSAAPYHFFLGQKIFKFLEHFQPQAVLLIDYGVFNLWLSGHLKKRGFKVFYFIPPQVWGSRKKRIEKIKANVDRVFCIFPFEEPLYQSHGIPVTFVGHPLIGQLPPPVDREAFCQQHGLDPNRKIVGLFPGSRKMEIDNLLKPMLQALPLLCEQLAKQGQTPPQFVLAKAPSLKEEYFQQKLSQAQQGLEGIQVTIVERQNHALLSASDALVVASGTVTLEAALYQTPMVLTYRASWLAYQLFKKLCYLPCLGLPNILTDMKNPIVPELLQDDVLPEKIVSCLAPLLDPNSEAAQKAKAGFQSIRSTLGAKNAIETLATELHHILSTP